MTRGIRNANPLNLRHGEKWQGLRKYQSDKQFCQFVDMKHGVRAAIIVLRTYYCVHGLRTISDIISRFAPTNENDTAAYIRILSNYVNIPAAKDVKFDFFDFSPCSTLYRMLRSMCQIESRFELDIDLFREALALVGEPQMQEYQRFIRLRNRICATDPS